jgi:uncharacterized protein YoaH (UPF0181 family)
MHAWEQQADESFKAHSAFRIYLQLGSMRTLDDASAKYHKHPPLDPSKPRAGRKHASGSIKDWSEKYDWIRRARAYDEHMRGIERLTHEKAVKESAERHIKIAQMLQQKAVERLKELKPEDLKAREVLDFLAQAVNMERLGQGSATQRLEHSGPAGGPITHEDITPESRRNQLAAILALLAERSSGRADPAATANGSGSQNGDGHGKPV